MIVYQKNKSSFIEDIMSNYIDNIVEKALVEKTGKRVGNAELRAFKNSLQYMGNVMNSSEIPNDCNISIEYHIPQTCKRVDFIISGSDNTNDNVIIVELKQWDKAELTDKDGIVKTHFQHGLAETSHPSYQAWSYATLLQSFNQTINDDNIKLYPCAYLHNYEKDGIIDNEFYDSYTSKAPLFFKPDAIKLQNFIKKFITKGDKNNILFRIDNGKIKPTKSLADSLSNMMKGNKEFILIDDQKVVYETALKLAKISTPKNKNVLIVKGGPGTGKSVVAINLLVELIKEGQLAQYVTKTSAPRDVYFEKLGGEMKNVELKALFVGSGAFMHTPQNAISTLIVDEAHRLTEKTGFLKMGDNQISEILDSSLFSIFFIDEAQRVHIDDYGDIHTIKNFANRKNIKITELQLDSQFRCNGSDGYLAWVDDVLQIRDTANFDFTDIDFDFKVFDSPNELRDEIYQKNNINNKARLVAGYCWPWYSKKDPKQYDIILNQDFKMRWNMTEYGGTWIINPQSVTEVGCIHTAQGLEVDYIGVIIGDDLTVRDGRILVDPSKRDRSDRTVFGYKKLMKEDPEGCKNLMRQIIKNTYRTLLTRGMKGCYIYCTDKETNEYFKKRANLK